MRRNSTIVSLATLALCLSVTGPAQAGQKHPGYSRALGDLRLARALLQRPSVSLAATGQQDEVTLTIGNIDSVTDEISKELTPSKKAPAVPRIDPRTPWGQRLAESLRLLESAREECSKERNNGGDAGLRARVLDQLDQAHTRITVAIETVNFDYSARDLPTRND